MSNFIYDWFKDIETVMTELVDPLTSHIVEVGSFEGRSTLWFMQHCPGAHITCIYHFRGGADQLSCNLDGLLARFAENLKGYEHRMTVFVEDAWNAWRHIDSEYSDLVFVDGSHIALDVIHDLTEAWRCVKRGGLIIADDYSWKNELPDCPKVAIDAFLQCAGPSAERVRLERVLAFRKL